MKRAKTAVHIYREDGFLVRGTLEGREHAAEVAAKPRSGTREAAGALGRSSGSGKVRKTALREPHWRDKTRAVN